MITSQDVFHRLQSIERDECAALQAYRRLAEDIADPTAGVVLTLLAHDTEQDRTLLKRLEAGALDALVSASCVAVDACDIAEIDALSRTACLRARHLREVASSERSLDHAPLAMLLEAMAADNDKDACLLEELARHLGWHDSRSGTSVSHRVNGKAYPVG